MTGISSALFAYHCNESLYSILTMYYVFMALVTVPRKRALINLIESMNEFKSMFSLRSNISKASILTHCSTGRIQSFDDLFCKTISVFHFVNSKT